MPKANRKNYCWIIIKNLAGLGLIVFLLAVIAGLAVFAYFAKDLPDPNQAIQREIIESTKIYDRTGEILLYEIHGEEKRTLVPFGQIPDYIKKATVVAEDDDFYHHIGLDIKAIIRALLADLRHKSFSQGGSTITQQFVKNALLTTEKTITRKIREAILSIELERRYSKDEILGFYLNEIPYGSNAYGIEAASQTFFGKTATGLNLAEAALLASLPKAPSYYSPYGSHPEALKQRQEYILNRMLSFGYISQPELDQALAYELKFSPFRQGQLKAPHFVMYIKERLEQEFGEKFIEQAGLKVYSTLDWDIQQKAEELVAKYGQSNEAKYKAQNMAAIVLDPKTGQILAMVGSRDYFDLDNDGNVNVTIRDRQPGSAFKPFAYATAFRKGFTPETIVFDLKTEFSTSTESYQPQNYDGKFRGPVSLRSGLAQSLNIPSVKTLYLAGISETINTAKDLGLTTLEDRDRFGLSLVLGGGEVKLLEMASAYGVFAQAGIKNPSAEILKIEDKDGQIVSEFEAKPTRVLTAQIANTINDILSDNQARAPMFGPNSKLDVKGFQVAAKTGSTQEYRDGWLLGYTPSVVVGLWVGNNDNQPMKTGSAGVYTTGPCFNDLMSWLVQEKIANSQNDNFTPPEPSVEEITKPMLNGDFVQKNTVSIDSVSGKLATDLTPPDLIIEKTYAQVHSILHYVDKNNPLGPMPDNPSRDPQYQNWEQAVFAWTRSPEQLTNGQVYNQQPPQEYDNIHIIANQPQITVNQPVSGQNINTAYLYVDISSQANLGIKQIDIFLETDFLGSAFASPYQEFIKIPAKYLNQSGSYNLTIKAYDTVGNKKEIVVPLKID